jgi:chaperone modulatory protein CbpM
MSDTDIMIGVFLDDVTLTLEELAHACGVEADWIMERIESEILKHPGEHHPHWRFRSIEVIRVRRLISIERDFDANPEVAALVVDLLEELDRQKEQLKAVGRA